MIKFGLYALIAIEVLLVTIERFSDVRLATVVQVFGPMSWPS